ncbi:putative ATP-dependent RNA helicase [uncultured archaeon]|nr:putative ATP-dependent RNA helicase [uncultured archaeon]
MTEDFDFSTFLNQGAIIDNRRSFNEKTVTLKRVLESLAKGSEAFKCAVGYFYIEGLSEIINSLDNFKEIKILMGSETTPKTKTELINAFKNGFDKIEKNETTIPAILLFHKLVKEAKTLKVKVYLGEDGNFQRLHSKLYLFIKDNESKEALDKYKAAVVGSSNLTPSGLIGNTELDVIIERRPDLQYLEKWFDGLWTIGTEEFEKLRVSDAIIEAIEKSKFGEHLNESYTYLEPVEFFTVLIKFLKADYLFEDWKKSGLFKFQVIDTIRCLRLFREKDYRGVFLTSSVGLGKSYVACQISEIHLREKKDVLIIGPANLVQSEDQWPRYLKEFNLIGKVHLVSMGALQDDPGIVFNKRFVNYSTGGKVKLDSENKYDLIIVDEAHNYRNPDAYRTRNLKRIIDLNGKAKILFLTATPINTRLEDLINLINLFHRPGANLYFDKIIRDFKAILGHLATTEFEDLTEYERGELVKLQEEVEKELFVKSTRETIKSDETYIQELKYFTGVDITNIPDPTVEGEVYVLHERYRPIVNGIVDFINSLSAAHLRIVDPEKGIRLGGFFKWVLYKRFESSIYAYYLTLTRLAKKNISIESAIQNRDIKYLEPEDEDDIPITFELDFKENLQKVIDKIKQGKGAEHLAILSELTKDRELIQEELKKLTPLLNKKQIFEDDKKLEKLEQTLREQKNKKILVFTEYKDTLKAIKQVISENFDQETIRFVSSDTKNKEGIIEKFNNKNSNLRILITTDTLSEGVNISGADIVINYDIPYNPVRIIQRIGRATRLDNPKEVLVINYKPDSDIDKELELVSKMDLRIKDIIKFVGVDYRVWIDKENEVKKLLEERRARDRVNYAKVLENIRNDVWSGDFSDLESKIQYTKPSLILLQKAINKYHLKREDIEKTQEIPQKAYTCLQGQHNLSVFYGNGETFNEEHLSKIDIKETRKEIILEREFKNELDDFSEQLKKEKQEELSLRYYNDRIDRKIYDVLDILKAEGYTEIYPKSKGFIDVLLSVKDNCGGTTEQVVNRIHNDIRKISNQNLDEWIERITMSFTRKHVQEKLVKESEHRLALALIE